MSALAGMMLDLQAKYMSIFYFTSSHMLFHFHFRNEGLARLFAVVQNQSNPKVGEKKN